MTSEKKETQREPCHGCCNEQVEGDAGLRCDQGHYLCPSCARTFIRSALSDFRLPLKCDVCSTCYHSSKLQAAFTPTEAEQYAQASAVLTVADDEVLIHCAFCRDGVIYDRYNFPLLYYCKNSDCRTTWCTVCRRKVEVETAAPSTPQSSLWATVQPHLMVCGSLATSKQALEWALQRGLHRACPYCGLEGMKDDACTHITCARCGHLWCYCCGRKVEECPKPAGSPEGNINCHNVDWKTDASRCPSHLEDFHEVDASCPLVASQALEWFHTTRTLGLLQAEVARLGAPTVGALLETYPAVLESFTLAQVEAFAVKPWMTQRRVLAD